jgi:hypothetical protein
MLEALAKLIRTKNEVDAQIAAIVGRPAQIQPVGEYVAAAVFDIELEPAAAHAGSDGRFTRGALAGKSVNVTWHGKNDGLLNLDPGRPADYYLVLTGPRTAATSSQAGTSPWLISSVYLFDGEALLREARSLGMQVGVATSIRFRVWDLAEIYPAQRNQLLPLTDEQRRELSFFGA